MSEHFGSNMSSHSSPTDAVSNGGPTSIAGRPKSLQKRKQILQQASQLFLRQGFTNTSMDLVAKASNVSKQTVYSHFKNKAVLFEAVINEKCAQYQLNDQALLESPVSLSDKLTQIAEHFIALMHDELVIAMYNVVIAEAKTHPEVAEMFYETGPQQATDFVSVCIKQTYPQLTTATTHALSIDFYNLLKSDFHMKSLLGLSSPMTTKEQKIFANVCCKKFQAILALQLTR